MVNIGDLLGKARKMISDNPDKIHAGLDKVEGVIDKSTGGKYRDKLAKGSEAIEGALGVPKGQRGTADPGTPGSDSPIPPAAPPTASPVIPPSSTDPTPGG